MTSVELHGLAAADGHADLLEAFWRYEDALMCNDVSALDALFEDSAHTIRSDAEGALVGHDEIARFRSARSSPAPRRRVVRVHARLLTPDAGSVIAETRRTDGSAGVQTQVWVRSDGAWRVTAAHVSSVAPTATGAAVIDAEVLDRVWRVELTPRPRDAQPVTATAHSDSAPLSGVRVAVKDLYAVAGHAVGAGVPAWLDAARPSVASAEAVDRLVTAGAIVAGIAHTDELAFGLGGDNPHYGAPPNPHAPGRLPGGSSGGCASAVALGLADLGLGTDTAGSIRVPASYCGLIGLRTTVGLASLAGAVPLAPSFDAVGLLAHDVGILDRALTAVAHRDVPRARRIETLVIDESLFELADPAVAETTMAAAEALAYASNARIVRIHRLARNATGEWFDAFRVVQMREAWRAHGEFVAAHPDALSPEVEARFRAGGDIEESAHSLATATLRAARARLAATVGEAVLVLPTTPVVAPRADCAEEVLAARTRSLPLTAISSWSGRPGISLPLGRVGALPVGLSLLGSPGDDRTLVSLAARMLD